MIIEEINTLSPQFILVRGVPGSGKSTFAKVLKENFNFEWFEADMWFYNTYGEYKWSKEDSEKAHEWCFDGFKKAILDRKNVIVSNTFIHKWQMERYIRFAKRNHYNITILKARGNYQNNHNVPQDTLKRMKENFEE